MGLVDQHLHSWHSFDSWVAPSVHVQQAIALGLDGLTFTEHFDTHPAEWPQCVYDDARISAELSELRACYGQALFIGKGIEVCYQPQQWDFILDFLRTHSFDLVLLSVHWAGGQAVHSPEYLSESGPELVMSRYLEAVAEATGRLADMRCAGWQPFHVLGHLDFAKRYINQFLNMEYEAPAGATLDRILKNCLAADLIPEVNTSPLRNGMSTPMPAPAIMRRYAELGGTMMSLGSDAHSAGAIGANFSQAVAMLRSAGITHSAVFRAGSCEPRPLPESIPPPAASPAPSG